MATLMIIALVVGVLIGAVGIGGILLIPALNLIGGLSIQSAMATSLFTFVFTGIAGTIAFQRHGSIDRRITVPVCAGALLCGFAGAWANALMNASSLMLILALLVAFAGVYTLITRRSERQPVLQQRPGMQRAMLFGLGGVAGFGSGLTGVGGPALSVPMMVLAGFAPLTAIGTSQVIQILAGVSGTLGNLRFGVIDYQLAAPLVLFELAGVIVGVRIVHAINAQLLRFWVGVLCVLVGAGLLLKVFGVL